MEISVARVGIEPPTHGFSVQRTNTCAGQLFGKIVLADAFPIYIAGGAVKASAERICVPEGNWDDFHSETIKLFHLIYFTGFNADGFGVEDETVHRKPDAGIAEWRRLTMNGRGGVDDFPVVGFKDPSLSFW